MGIYNGPNLNNGSAATLHDVIRNQKLEAEEKKKYARELEQQAKIRDAEKVQKTPHEIKLEEQVAVTQLINGIQIGSPNNISIIVTALKQICDIQHFLLMAAKPEENAGKEVINDGNIPD